MCLQSHPITQPRKTRSPRRAFVRVPRPTRRWILMGRSVRGVCRVLKAMCSVTRCSSGQGTSRCHLPPLSGVYVSAGSRQSRFFRCGAVRRVCGIRERGHRAQYGDGAEGDASIRALCKILLRSEQCVSYTDILPGFTHLIVYFDARFYTFPHYVENTTFGVSCGAYTNLKDTLTRRRSRAS